MAKRKRETAAEFTARLQDDPAYMKMRVERDTQLAEKAARLRAEQAPMLADLELVGWNVKSVWDLVNTKTPYPEAIPVLLDHLKRPYSDRIREGIARALAVRDAAGAWSTLLAEYKASLSGSDVKDGLAAALSTISTDEVIGELASVARDTQNGSSRLLLLRGLKRSRSTIAHDALADLKNDPELAKEIASWRKPGISR